MKPCPSPPAPAEARALRRLEAAGLEAFRDAAGEKLRRTLREDLKVACGPIRAVRALTLAGRFSAAEAWRIGREIFADPIVERLFLDGQADDGDAASLKVAPSLAGPIHGDFAPLRDVPSQERPIYGDFAPLMGVPSLERPVDGDFAPLRDAPSQEWPIYGDFAFAVCVSFRPGVTDNVARSAAEGIEFLLGRKLGSDEEIHSATVWAFLAPGPTPRELERVCNEVLYNPLIEKVEALSRAQWEAGQRFAPPVPAPALGVGAVEPVPLSQLSDAELEALSRARVLALSLEEMRAVQSHFRDPVRRAARRAAGLPEEPTDAEIEAIAQTWSEHCKHKIFAGIFEVEDEGRRETVDSLFKTFIAAPTRQIMRQRGDIASVFSDNAGVFHFSEELDVCIKVETHNSPSALEPYGGAMTGIVGVNRDVLGTGQGFRPILNTDVFCFGPPDHGDALPPRLLHPRRILRGVHRGIKDGGNQSGIPTVNGSISFDPRYIGKPLVFCGTAGLAPRRVCGRASHEKSIAPGDAAVMVGGRVGADGIHGATMSSEGLSEVSPTSAVQIGDPITQKRMIDFILEARDLGLYRFITDNGAGGLSSSIGEMARECGGARIDLAAVPLKAAGLAPWHILVSESQERMSLAVPPDKLGVFLDLARRRGVLAAAIGAFTASGCFEVFHGERPVARLELEFLHEGAPRLRIRARWSPPQGAEARDGDLPALDAALARAMLARWNICSKEDWVREYDHEVQGMSVIKPFCGERADGPSDAAVLRPDPGTYRALAIAHGLRARFSDIDAGRMAANAVDEALASLVCAGADPDTAVGLDNFCWPDPLPGANNPDAEHKAAQLVRACRALADICLAYKLPCISGKDSMKNDYVFPRSPGERVGEGAAASLARSNAGVQNAARISVPPTLLFTAVGVVPDARRALTSDFKRPGDLIFLLGETKDELGGSELYAHLGLIGIHAPAVEPRSALTRYRALHRLAREGVLASAHDLSEGGLLVALAESCFGGRLGARLELHPQGSRALHPVRFFFSESASRILVSLSPEHEERLRREFAGQEILCLGRVQQAYRLEGGDLPTLELDSLYESWRTPLGKLL